MQREREKEHKRRQKEDRKLERARELELRRERDREFQRECERRVQSERERRIQLERDHEQDQQHGQQSSFYRRFVTDDDPMFGELTSDMYPDCFAEPRFHVQDELGFELSDMERFRPAIDKPKSGVSLSTKIGSQDSVSAVCGDLSYTHVNLTPSTEIHSPQDCMPAISEVSDNSNKSLPQASSSATVSAPITSTDNSTKPTHEQVSTCSESQTIYNVSTTTEMSAKTNLRETISMESARSEVKRSKKAHSSSHFFAPPKESIAKHSMSSAELTSLYNQRRMCDAIAAARNVENPPDDPCKSVGPGYLPRPSLGATKPTFGSIQRSKSAVQSSTYAAQSSTSSAQNFISTAGPSTSSTQPLTDDAQLAKSSGQLNLTADRPSTSFTQQSMSADHICTDSAKPSTSYAQAAKYEAHPSTSYAQPATFEAQPSTSFTQHSMSADHICTDFAKPSMSYAQAAMYGAQPSTSYAQPATYVAQPSTSYAQPAMYEAQPSTSYAQPAMYDPQPSTSYAQPATYTTQPSTYSPQPFTSNAQPATCAAQPSTSSPRPSTSNAPFFTSAAQGPTSPRGSSICGSGGEYPNERLHHSIVNKDKFHDIRRKIAMLTFHDIPPVNYEIPISIRSPTFIAPKKQSILLYVDEPNVEEENVDQQHVDQQDNDTKKDDQQGDNQMTDEQKTDDPKTADQNTDDQKTDDQKTDDQKTDDQQTASSGDQPKRKFKSATGRFRRPKHNTENIIDVSLGRMENILEMVLTIGYKISKGEKDTFGTQQVPTPIHNAMVDIRKFLEPMKNHLKECGRAQYFRPYLETITDALNPLYHHLNDGLIALKSPATRNYVSLPYEKKPMKKITDEPIQMLYSMVTPPPYSNFDQQYTGAPSTPLSHLPPLYRPRVVPMGLIEMPFMRDLMVILTVDLGITVINREDNVVVALSADGTRSGFKFRYGEVYQRQNEVIDLNCLDPFHRIHKRARFCHRGIIFTDEMSPMTYCITQGGTVNCQRLISNANGRLLGESFYYGSRYGQVYVSECTALLEFARNSYDEDGSITWIISNLRIKQTIDGELIIHKEHGNYSIIMQPSMPDEDQDYAMTINCKLTTPLYRVTCSVASLDIGVKHHFFVRQDKRSVFCNNEKFMVRNSSQTAGIDRDHNIRLHI